MLGSGSGIFCHEAHEPVVKLLCEDDPNVQPSILIHSVQRVLAHGTIPQSQDVKVIPLIPVNDPENGTRLIRVIKPRVEGKVQHYDQRA